MKEYDARYISEDVKSHINPKITEKIVKEYRIFFTFSFCDFNGIDDIINDVETNEIYYVLFNSKIQTYYYTQKDELLKTKTDSSMEYKEYMISKMLNEKDVLKNISSDINVNNVYLFEDYSRLGTIIYYETDKGDYVYYPSYYDIKGNRIEYLVPVEKFSELMIAVKKERDRVPYSAGGAEDISLLYDLTPYVIDTTPKPLNMFFVFGLASAGLVVVGLLVVVALKFVKRKRKTKHVQG
ncbi:MAG: hypothetical protein GX567_16025 [Clostridia bacterium]|nr:hypothetical protein [Clostridia bacterium]